MLDLLIEFLDKSGKVAGMGFGEGLGSYLRRLDSYKFHFISSK